MTSMLKELSMSYVLLFHSKSSETGSQFGPAPFQGLNNHMQRVATAPVSTDLKPEPDQVTPEPKPSLTPHHFQDKIPAPLPGTKGILQPALLGSEQPHGTNYTFRSLNVPSAHLPLSLSTCCSCCLKGCFPIHLKFPTQSSIPLHPGSLH